MPTCPPNKSKNEHVPKGNGHIPRRNEYDPKGVAARMDLSEDKALAPASQHRTCPTETRLE